MQSEQIKKAAGAEYLTNTEVGDVYSLRQPLPIPEQTPRHQPKPEPIRRVVSDWVINTVIVAALLIVMVVIFQYISRVALLNEYNKQLGRVNTSIREAQQQTAHLDILIAEAGRMERIETEARGRLGMREPVPEEIRYITMPG